MAIISVDQFFQSPYTNNNSEGRVVRINKMETLNKVLLVKAFMILEIEEIKIEKVHIILLLSVKI